MKLTDFAIILQVFFICLLVVLHVNGNMIHNKVVSEAMYNNCMDNITEDALKSGYTAVGYGGKPVVDLSELRRAFKSFCELYNNLGEHILIYIEENGFYESSDSYGDDWTDINMFPNNGKSHERNVEYINSYIKEVYGIDTSIPVGAGETWMNTLKPYSLIVISYNSALDIYCLSGACIHKVDRN